MERKGQRGSSPTTAIATPGSGGSWLRSTRHGRSGRQWTAPSSPRARCKLMFNGGEEQPEHRGATGASRSSRSATGSLSDDHHRGDASSLRSCCLEQAGAAAWSKLVLLLLSGVRAGRRAEQGLLPGSRSCCLGAGGTAWSKGAGSRGGRRAGWRWGQS